MSAYVDAIVACGVFGALVVLALLFALALVHGACWLENRHERGKARLRRYDRRRNARRIGRVRGWPISWREGDWFMEPRRDPSPRPRR